MPCGANKSIMEDLDVISIYCALYQEAQGLIKRYQLKKEEKQKEYPLDHRKLSTVFIRHNADRLFYADLPVFPSFFIIKIRKKRTDKANACKS